MQKRIALKKSDIYAILDTKTLEKRNIANFVENLIKNDIKIIQLRDKESSFREILKRALLIKRKIKNQALFIINDSPEICLLVDADGIHLGQNDLPLKFSRKILGKDKIIGISCHNLEQAKVAQKEGADYIGFGPIFKTPTKNKCRPIGTKEITLLKQKIKIPFFIIGGIDVSQLKNLGPLKIERIAVCRTLCQTDNITKEIKHLRKYLNK